MMTTYFNALRDKGIKVNPEDTIWIDLFVRYVIKNKLMNREKLQLVLDRTLEVIKPGQTSKDVVELLKKFDIDYTPIDEKYLQRLNEYSELFKQD